MFDMYEYKFYLIMYNVHNTFNSCVTYPGTDPFLDGKLLLYYYRFNLKYLALIESNQSTNDKG